MKPVFQAIPRPSEYRESVPADLEAVAMRLEAASRDGRGDLVRLLAERFPRPRNRRRASRPPELGLPSNGPITVSDTSAPPSPGQGPGQAEPGSGQSRAGTLKRARRRWRWRWWWLAFGVLFALALAMTIALLVAR